MGPNQHFRLKWILPDFVIGIIVTECGILVRVERCAHVRVCVSICTLMRTMMSGSQHEMDVTVEGRSCLGCFPAVWQAALSQL